MAEELGNQIGSMMRMLRTIEQRYTTMRQKLRLGDQNVLGSQKQHSSDIRALSAEITELQNSMETIQYKLGLLNKQLEQTAALQDVEIMQHYIELWQPMNFITKQEAEKLLKLSVKKSVREE